MRNELNDIEKIERYLRNEMGADEKISFEKEMEQNPTLKKSVDDQNELLKGIDRMKMKKNISSAKFKYKFMKGAVNIGIPALVTTAITALILNYTSKNNKPETPNPKPETKTEYKLPELNETGDSLWADADKYIPYQVYSLKSNRDTVIVGKDGTILSIPANSFVDENGNPVVGNIDFELKEAVTTEAIMKGGLSTYSNGELLETGGMFYINARQNGKSLKIAEGKNIYADVPSDPNKPGMMLFDGERKADGSINWVNPKPIEKPLVAVDIHSLNFYPPKYEDSLATMGKDVANKKYKDSLYYSFAGRFNIIVKNIKITENSNTDSISKTVAFSNPTESKLTIDPDKNSKYAEFVKTYRNNGYDLVSISKSDDDLGSVKFEYLRKDKKIIFLFAIKSNFSTGIIRNVKFDYHLSTGKGFKLPITINNGISSKKGEEEYQFFENEITSSKDFTLSGQCSYNFIFMQNGIEKNYKKTLPFSHEFLVNSNETKNFSGLNPAKVKSIWNDKFQNTLIATKEFEERMPYIHQLCSRGNNVLDLYVKNIDKKMCTIDSMVANTLSGSDKEQFLKFAARGEGRVKTEDNCLKKLGDYYDEQTKIYTEVARKTADDYYKKNQESEEMASNKYLQHSKEEIERNQNNFQTELDKNLENAFNQLDKKFQRTGTISNTNISSTVKNRRYKGFTTPRIRTTVRSTGWKNVDRYTTEATQNRTSMNFKDKSGKTAILKYEPVSVSIQNVKNYDRVLVYLLPDELNSFMRMKNEGNEFTEKLNMLFKHELVVIAYKGEQAYFKYLNEINAHEKYDISLSEISEKELNQQLGELKKMQHAGEMKKDVAHQYFLLADAKRRKAFLEKEKFIRRIEKVIFPCGNGVDEDIPIVAPASENYFQEF